MTKALSSLRSFLEVQLARPLRYCKYLAYNEYIALLLMLTICNLKRFVGDFFVLVFSCMSLFLEPNLVHVS